MRAPGSGPTVFPVGAEQVRGAQVQLAIAGARPGIDRTSATEGTGSRWRQRTSWSGPRPGAVPSSRQSYEEATLHGHRIGFQAAGEGPLLLLLHGITSTSDAWREVMPALAERYTVVAPDMIGHGRSAKPRGDYSLGAYAAGVRDLLGVLGFETGTVVGHSLGGGIAMQLAYPPSSTWNAWP
ncbi:MAG: alpha/beta fold hydrolase [Solirubrobacterales bacterium]